jgi:hypothetical protein
MDMVALIENAALRPTVSNRGGAGLELLERHPRPARRQVNRITV